MQKIDSIFFLVLNTQKIQKMRTKNCKKTHKLEKCQKGYIGSDRYIAWRRGTEVTSNWCVAFTILVIPDIIAMFWNRFQTPQLQALVQGLVSRYSVVSKGAPRASGDVEEHINKRRRSAYHAARKHGACAEAA